MGPIALFDKSFLEGLSVDEAVLFDHFFYPVTCPIFYVETLADLEKLGNEGRTPEEIVGSISFKSPQMHGGPNVHHRTLVVRNLLGSEIAMTGQIVVAGGRPVRVDGKNNVVFESSVEAEAFGRWQRGQFDELERSFAKSWREDLRTVDLNEVAKQAHLYGVDLRSCKNIDQAKVLSECVINQLTAADQISFAIEKFRIDGEVKAAILKRWEAIGGPDLRTYAPYGYFVLMIEVFFEIALATGKISADRPSNINDLAYLFYLPFCMVFLSSDRLHRVCAPLFMRDDQEFIWGLDIKADLRANHDELIQLPEQVRLRGLLSLSPTPRTGGLINEVYSRHLGSTPRRSISPKPEQTLSSDLVERIERLRRAPTMPLDEVDFAPNDADSITIERLIQKKRGSWFQVPHDTKPTHD